MFAAAALGLLSAACGSNREELSWPVDQLGRHRIAYREYHVEYTPEGASEERSLRLAIWYPTPMGGGTPAKYMGSYERGGVQAAGPLIEAEKLPVAIFSHGNLSFAEQSWFLPEYFTSHGFLVLAPDHTGNTLVNAGGERPREMFTLRPRDISAVLDAANALPGLSDRAAEEVIVFGHSFGGYTALAAAGAEFAASSGFSGALGDERIDAAIGISAGNHATFEGGGVAKIEVPVMLMMGAKDRAVMNATEGDLYWSELDGEFDRRVDFPNAGHHSFDVACEIFPLLGENDGCGEGFISPPEAHFLSSVYALAFARRHLFDDEAMDPILDGTTTFSEEATISAK